MERKIEKEVLKNIEDWKKWNEKHLKSGKVAQVILPPPINEFPCVVVYYIDDLDMIRFTFVSVEDLGIVRVNQVSCLELRLYTNSKEECLKKLLIRRTNPKVELEELVDYIYSTPIDKLIKEKDEKISIQDILNGKVDLKELKNK